MINFPLVGANWPVLLLVRAEPVIQVHSVHTDSPLRIAQLKNVKNAYSPVFN